VIIYYKLEDNKIYFIFSVENINNKIDKNPIYTNKQIKELNYIILEDSELPKPVGYYEICTNDNAIIFIDKETKAEIKPKIIEHKVR